MKKEGGFYKTHEVTQAIEECLYDYLIDKFEFRKSNRKIFGLEKERSIVYKNDLFIYFSVDRIEGYEIYCANFNNPETVPKRLNSFYRITYKKITEYNRFIRNEYSNHNFNLNSDYSNTKYVVQKIVSFIEENYPEVLEKGDISILENS